MIMLFLNFAHCVALSKEYIFPETGSASKMCLSIRTYLVYKLSNCKGSYYRSCKTISDNIFTSVT
jgi:hypothetical protein